MVEDFDWSPDGNIIAVAYSPSHRLEDYYLNSSIALIDLKSGHFTPWKNQAQHESVPRFSPDGTTIAYLSSGQESSFFCDSCYCLRTTQGTKFRELALTPNEGPFLDEVSFLGWSQDGKNLIAFEPNQTQMEILWIPVDGTAPKSFGKQVLSIRYASLSFDRTHISFIGQLLIFLPKSISQVWINLSRLKSPRATKKLSNNILSQKRKKSYGAPSMVCKFKDC